MTLSPDEGNDIAVVNLVRTDGTPELSHRLSAPVQNAELIVNLRAEDDPDRLWSRTEAVLSATAAEYGVSAEIGQHEFFRPSKPNPTYRMATL
jgi:hypothetical protein